jgi:hypothetical protein
VAGLIGDADTLKKSVSIKNQRGWGRTMWAIVLAVVTGVIGFLAKIVLDIRTEHQARKAVAAALAGELGAYLRLSQPERTAENIKAIAKIPYEERVVRMRGLFSLPSSHPVFDQVADKIGVLSPQAARGISEAYNIITCARLFLTALCSDTFLQAPDQVQVSRITVMADVFAQEIEGMRRTVTLLDRLSRQSFCCYLMACDSDSC